MLLTEDVDVDVGVDQDEVVVDGAEVDEVAVEAVIPLKQVLLQPLTRLHQAISFAGHVGRKGIDRRHVQQSRYTSPTPHLRQVSSSLLSSTSAQ
jgi:hypothetical protein